MFEDQGGDCNGWVIYYQPKAEAKAKRNNYLVVTNTKTNLRLFCFFLSGNRRLRNISGSHLEEQRKERKKKKRLGAFVYVDRKKNGWEKRRNNNDDCCCMCLG